MSTLEHALIDPGLAGKTRPHDSGSTSERRRASATEFHRVMIMLSFDLQHASRCRNVRKSRSIRSGCAKEWMESRGRRAPDSQRSPAGTCSVREPVPSGRPRQACRVAVAPTPGPRPGRSRNPRPRPARSNNWAGFGLRRVIPADVQFAWSFWASMSGCDRCRIRREPPQMILAKIDPARPSPTDLSVCNACADTDGSRPKSRPLRLVWR